MKKFYLLFVLALQCSLIFAQVNVTVNVTDDVTLAPISGVDVTADGITLTTDLNGDAIFSLAPNSSYPYTSEAECYLNGSGSLNVATTDFTEPVSITAITQTDATVFFFLSAPGEPAIFTPVDVTLTGINGNTNNYNFTYDFGAFAESLSGVAYGDYTITYEGECRATATSSVTVSCDAYNNPNPGVIEQFDTIGEQITETDATVFFFLSAPGEPAIFTPVDVTLTGINGNTNNYNFTYDFGSFAESLSGVAYGDYTITYEGECRATATSSVTVSCDAYNNPNPGVIEQFDTIGEQITETDATVFFFLSAPGEPAIFTPVDVTLTGINGNTNNYNFTYDFGAFAESLSGVAYGDYTITYEGECRATATSSVTVSCDAYNNPNPGVIEQFDTIGEQITETDATVFFFLSAPGEPAIFTPVDVTLTGINGNTNNYNFTYDFGSFAESLSGVAYGDYTITYEGECRATATSSVTVSCDAYNNPNPGVIEQFDTIGEQITETDATVFFFLSAPGEPAIFTPVDVTLTGINGNTNNYNFTYDFGAFAESLSGVAYGDYTITYEGECRATATSSVTVSCDAYNNPNPGVIEQFDTIGEQITETDATVFFFLSAPGEPAIFTPVDVTLTGINGNTNNYNFTYDFGAFAESLSGVAYGDYTITYEGECRATATSSVTVSCDAYNNPNPGVIEQFDTIGEQITETDATVFFFLSAPGEPAIFTPVDVTLTGINGNTNNYNFTYDFGAFAESLSGVAYGDYTITYEGECRATATSSVTVSCDAYNNPNPGVIEQFDTIGEQITETDATVFFFLSAPGEPAIFTPVDVTLTGINGNTNNYNFTYDFGAFAESLSGVAYGDYTITYEGECRATATSSVTVSCDAYNNPNPGVIEQFDTIGEQITETDATVFFFLSAPGEPAIFTPVDVTLTGINGNTNNYNFTYDFGAFAESLSGVAYGDYTITYEGECRATATSSVTVSCDAYNNPNPGVIEQFDTIGEQITETDATVFFFLSAPGEPAIFTPVDVTLTGINGNTNNYNFTYDFGAFAESLSGVAYGDYTITYEGECRATATSSVTVSCDAYNNPNPGVIEQFDTIGEQITETDATVFFFLSAPGEPAIFTPVDVTLTGINGNTNNYNFTYDFGAFAESLSGVAYGDYTITYEGECRATATSSVTVSCDAYNNPNPGVIEQFDTIGEQITETDATVFFFLSAPGEPAIFTPVDVTLTGINGNTNNYNFTYDFGAFAESLSGVAYGDYTITYEGECRATATSSVTVSCDAYNNPNPGVIEQFDTIGEQITETDATVFFFLSAPGEPAIFTPVDVTLTGINGNTNNYNFTYDFGAFAESLSGVAYGDYTITYEGECRATATSSVTVSCDAYNNPNPGVIEQFDTIGEQITETDATVFFFLSAPGEPAIFTPVDVTLTGINGNTNNYNFTYDFGAFAESLSGVAYGDYTITYEGECRATATSSVTVSCDAYNNPNPGVIEQFDTIGEQITETDATVFFFLSAPGEPAIFTPVDVTLTGINGNTNNYNFTYDFGAFAESLSGVAYGDYTITYEGECRATATSSVTVSCDAYNNPNPGVIEQFDTIGEQITETDATVFFFLSAPGEPAIFTPVDVTLTGINGNTNNYNFTYDFGSFAESLSGVAYGDYTITYEGECRATATSSVTVSCDAYNNPNPGVIEQFDTIGEQITETDATVFFFLSAPGEPAIFTPVDVTLTGINGNTNNYNFTYDFGAFAESLSGVAYGDYTITYEGECRATATSSVTVSCDAYNNPNPGVIEQFDTIGEQITETDATVFFFLSAPGEPAIFTPVDVTLTGINGNTNNYNFTYDFGSFAESLSGVAYGDYTITYEGECRATATSSVTVSCDAYNNPNPGVIEQFDTIGEQITETDATVFFFLSAPGEPAIFTPVDVTLTGINGNTNNYNFTYDFGAFAESLSGVAYGDYTITYEGECRATATSSVTVSCDAYNNPNPGVIEQFDTIGEQITETDATVFFFLSAPGEPAIFTPVDVTLTGINGNTNNYNFTYDFGAFAESLSGVAYGDYTITYEGECRATATSSVTVSCDAYNNPNPGVIEQFDTIGSEIVIDTNVTQNMEMLSADESGPDITYQWIDCNNGNAPIDGETNQMFTATANGSYAVIITNANCSVSETSACIEIDTLSIESNTARLDAKLFPNPVVDNLTIKFGNYFDTIQIQVFSIVGQLIETIEIKNSIEHKINMSDLPSGSYLITINADGNTNSKVILKK